MKDREPWTVWMGCTLIFILTAVPMLIILIIQLIPAAILEALYDSRTGKERKPGHGQANTTPTPGE